MGIVTPILSDGETALLALLPDTEAGDAARLAISSYGLPTRKVEAISVRHYQVGFPMLMAQQV